VFGENIYKAAFYIATPFAMLSIPQIRFIIVNTCNFVYVGASK
jgi:hypothetical protein